jgi:hypothetical protein
MKRGLASVAQLVSLTPRVLRHRRFARSLQHPIWSKAGWLRPNAPIEPEMVPACLRICQLSEDGRTRGRCGLSRSMLCRYMQLDQWLHIPGGCSPVVAGQSKMGSTAHHPAELSTSAAWKQCSSCASLLDFASVVPYCGRIPFCAVRRCAFPEVDIGANSSRFVFTTFAARL